MIEITLDSAIEAVRAAVDEKGKYYTYAPVSLSVHGAVGCVYVHDGAPSCAVGHAMVNLGVPIHLFTEEDEFGVGLNVDTDACGLLAALARDGELSMPLDAEEADQIVTFLAAVQDKQDDGRPWGEALQYGLDKVGK